MGLMAFPSTNQQCQRTEGNSSQENPPLASSCLHPTADCRGID